MGSESLTALSEEDNIHPDERETKKEMTVGSSIETELGKNNDYYFIFIYEPEKRTAMYGSRNKKNWSHSGQDENVV